MENYPFISCICPTYNRRKYLPILIYLFKQFEYPKDKIELIILDDSNITNIDIIQKYKEDYNIIYYYSKRRLNIGEKRNILNNYASGEYITCLDDDDYFPPNRILYTINKMLETKSLLSGCENIHIYSINTKKIYLPNQCKIPCNGSLTYHKDYLLNNRYDNKDQNNEEVNFLKNFKNSYISLEPKNIILHIFHNENTIDKNRYCNKNTETNLIINDFIDDIYILNFYNNL